MDAKCIFAIGCAACLACLRAAHAESTPEPSKSYPEIEFPIVCTVEKLASVTPRAITDKTTRMVLNLDKDEEYLNVGVAGGMLDDVNVGAPFGGRYKLVDHSYYVHAEKSASSYGGELSLVRDATDIFGHGKKALILKATHVSHSSAVAAAGICNERSAK